MCPGLPEASLSGMWCHVRSRFSPIARSSAHRAKAPHRNRSPDDADVDEGGTPETNKQRSESTVTINDQTVISRPSLIVEDIAREV